MIPILYIPAYLLLKNLPGNNLIYPIFERNSGINQNI